MIERFYYSSRLRYEMQILEGMKNFRTENDMRIYLNV